jgi:hypothetical protein
MELVCDSGLQMPGGLFVLRGVPWMCWRHRDECDACVAELSADTVDAVVESILPLFEHVRGRKVRFGGTVCGKWQVSRQGVDRLYSSLHRRVLKCVRR